MNNKTKTKKEICIALDFGGTWIKGCMIDLNGSALSLRPSDVTVIPNPARSLKTGLEFSQIVIDLCQKIARGKKIRHIVASTAGEVDAGGSKYLIAGEHLGLLGTSDWRKSVEDFFKSPVELINDAESFVLGLALKKEIPIEGSVGSIVIGTGIGFSVVREGRWWKPSRSLHFLGSLRSHGGSYDEWGSATKAANLAGGDLCAFLVEDKYSKQRKQYWDGIAQIIASASIVYHLDTVILGGGIVDACQKMEILIPEVFSKKLTTYFPHKFHLPLIRQASQGNLTTLQGALTLAQGNCFANRFKYNKSFSTLSTESSNRDVPIDKLLPEQMVMRLLKAEKKASLDLLDQATPLAKVSSLVAKAIRKEGRVIYVGAGTSGRVAAIDAVEIPCTFGEAPTRFVPVIAGGISDSALTIESDNEEDHSSVSDLILLGVKKEDIVIGISASGTAFFVRSALAYAKSKGAATVLIRESEFKDNLNVKYCIQLRSGNEVVRGSTRLKAGTATKKVLNIISTTAMTLLGRVRDGMMIDVQCCNEKLRRRAERILSEIAKIEPSKAHNILTHNQFSLRNALKELEK